ncbi:MAG: hypothetical protein OD918_06610 [Gammaproteobacteria bacterium]
MKWLLTLMLAANIAFYLWAGGRGARIEHAAAPPATADVNREGMLLLHELGAREDAPADRAALCYRIGPFKRETAWRAAREWMRAQQFPHTATRSTLRRMRALRVYLGPFNARGAAEAEVVARRLAQKNIAYFIDVRKPGEVRVSLGYFIQPALAARYIANLRALHDIHAKKSVEYPKMGPHDWIEASIDPAQRETLASRVWGDAGVTAATVDCGELAG